MIATFVYKSQAEATSTHLELVATGYKALVETIINKSPYSDSEKRYLAENVCENWRRYAQSNHLQEKTMKHQRKKETN